MKIKTVTYSRMEEASKSRYSNHTVTLTAEVSDKDNPSDVLDELHYLACEKLGLSEQPDKDEVREAERVIRNAKWWRKRHKSA